MHADGVTALHIEYVEIQKDWKGKSLKIKYSPHKPITLISSRDSVQSKRLFLSTRQGVQLGSTLSLDGMICNFEFTS